MKPRRPVAAISRQLMAAAVACKLSRSQAKELLAETLATGLSTALKPVRRGVVARKLDDNTVNVVLAAMARRAA